MGGIFAGLLRLNLNDDPLKEWVTRTVEASGITEEDINADGSKPEEEVPQQIDIEWHFRWLVIYNVRFVWLSKFNIINNIN